jgi:hypothetical protein
MLLGDFLRVLGGILNAVVCGSLESWGMILPYVASYYRFLDPGVSVIIISSVIACLSLVQGVGCSTSTSSTASD